MGEMGESSIEEGFSAIFTSGSDSGLGFGAWVETVDVGGRGWFLVAVGLGCGEWGEFLGVGVGFRDGWSGGKTGDWGVFGGVEIFCCNGISRAWRYRHRTCLVYII